MNFKKLLLGIALLFSCVVLAQEKGDFNVFAGVSYPLASGSDVGATAGVEYVFAENISAAPSFTYYFAGSGFTSTQFDVDARYYLGDESFNWFVTAGISINSVSFGGVSASSTGFTGGAGALFSLGESMNLLASVKYNSETNGGGVLPMLGVSFGL